MKWNVTGLSWYKQRGSYLTDPPAYAIDRSVRRCYEALRLEAGGRWVRIFRGRVAQCQIVCELDSVQRSTELEGS